MSDHCPWCRKRADGHCDCKGWTQYMEAAARRDTNCYCLGGCGAVIEPEPDGGFRMTCGADACKLNVGRFLFDRMVEAT